MADIGACFNRIGDVPTTLTFFFLVYRADGEGYVDATYAEMAKALNRSRTMVYKYVIRLASVGAIKLCSEQTVNKRLTSGEQKKTYIYIPQISYYKKITHTNTDVGVNKRLTSGEQKVNNAETLEERVKKFREALSPFVSKYGEKMIEDFFNHWSQVNEGGKKMHWEKQKTFEISKRLATWKRNNYGNGGSEQRMHADGTILHKEQMNYDKGTW